MSESTEPSTPATTTETTSDQQGYFDRLSETTYAPTDLVEGAWDTADQHVAPLHGLLIDHLRKHEARDDLVLARISHDILGRIPRSEVQIETQTVRAGRTIELVEATATIEGRTVVRTRAWRLTGRDTADLTGNELPRAVPVQYCRPYDIGPLWPGRFITTLRARTAVGGRPGWRAVWLESPVPLVTGETADPAVRLLALVDVANGIATRVGADVAVYPNIDLTIHLLREPSGDQLGLDTSVSFGSNGIGLTSSVLSDVDGPFGRAEQTLTIRPR